MATYEKSDYIGGRKLEYLSCFHPLSDVIFSLGSTPVFPCGDPSIQPVELGASIFVDATKKLIRVVKEYNLSEVELDEEAEDIGIWDEQ